MESLREHSCAPGEAPMSSERWRGGLDRFEPRQTSIEHDRAAIPHRRWPDAHDRASSYSRPHARAIVLALDEQLHCRPWTQPVMRFDERATGRDVDERHLMSGPQRRGHDAVYFDAVMARGIPAVHAVADGAYIGSHCRARASNFSTRTLPVCP